MRSKQLRCITIHYGNTIYRYAVSTPQLRRPANLRHVPRWSGGTPFGGCMHTCRGGGGGRGMHAARWPGAQARWRDAACGPGRRSCAPLPCCDARTHPAGQWRRARLCMQPPPQPQGGQAHTLPVPPPSSPLPSNMPSNAYTHHSSMRRIAPSPTHRNVKGDQDQQGWRSRRPWRGGP